MTGLLNKLGICLMRIIFPSDKIFRETVIPEIDEETKLARQILSIPGSKIPGFKNNSLLQYLKQKHQPGKYDVSYLYDGCRKETREVYKIKHNLLCQVLYD